MVGLAGVPLQSGRCLAEANRSTNTPLGITTASPPRWVVTVRRASSETAIRALIFSRLGRSNGYAACMARERRLDVWKVATIGPSTAQRARTETLGVTGSWRWTTSKRPASTQRPTRAAVSGPNDSRATEPLYRTGTARPELTT